MDLVDADAIVSVQVVTASVFFDHNGSRDRESLDVQNVGALLPPPLAHGETMRQIAQVAQHASIFDRAGFTSLVARVPAMGAYKCEYAFEDRGGEVR